MFPGWWRVVRIATTWSAPSPDVLTFHFEGWGEAGIPVPEPATKPQPGWDCAYLEVAVPDAGPDRLAVGR